MNIKRIFLFTIAIIVLCSNIVLASEIDEEQILVPSAILVETNTNQILYEKNAYQRMYPASTTKIMTAILTIENCDLNENVTVPYSAISDIPDGYAIANLKVGEVLTVEQLLNLTLIESANDAANVLAEYIAGSEESFASMMNTKAIEIGCKDTNFISSYGRHYENHYSTAYDLYLIAKYAMQNDIFRNIVRKSLYVVYPTNMTETERKVENTNRFLNTSSDFYDKRVIGIKTGFTTPAGNCLVSCATENDIEVICVVLGGGLYNENIPYQQYISSRELFNYTFENYSYKKLCLQNDYFDTIQVENATDETKNLKLLVDMGITAFVKNSEQEITPQVELNENILAPIKAGDILGTISYDISGINYTANLIAANNVEVAFNLILIFIIFTLILVLFLLYKITKKYKKRNRRKK